MVLSDAIIHVAIKTCVIFRSHLPFHGGAKPREPPFVRFHRWKLDLQKVGLIPEPRRSRPTRVKTIILRTSFAYFQNRALIFKKSYINKSSVFFFQKVRKKHLYDITFYRLWIGKIQFWHFFADLLEDIFLCLVIKPIVSVFLIRWTPLELTGVNRWKTVFKIKKRHFSLNFSSLTGRISIIPDENMYRRVPDHFRWIQYYIPSFTANFWFFRAIISSLFSI